MIGIKVRDRWRNTDIRKKSRVRDCRYVAKKLKWLYAGHIPRRKEGRWEKKVLEWEWTFSGKGRWVDPSQDGIKSNNSIAWIEMLGSAIGGKKLGRPTLSNERINYKAFTFGVCLHFFLSRWKSFYH